MPRLVLKRPHTHAGRAYQAGERIDVNARTADWLIAHGVVAPDAAPDAAPPAPSHAPADLPPDRPRSHRKEPKP
jgi:hypothetical protein